MARFQCKCGATLTNTIAPNDVELRVYTDKEWDDILNLGDSIDPVTIPFPRYDVWRCNDCERIYVFDGDTVIKTYMLEDDN
ncbi:hypothetical protein HUB98_07220 [Paenibacillus barcinonensis]|uniref:Uncharacterized protein n=1 Tax=Paenibacillus barcinonensis TaxID=198119 RepID=A0A2V4UNP9_PAEBA|nr:hypothetical protein [Paenibacillus barcinonensis]PYE41857.1 hypothetical protein DFQ00_1512 [Paenibacillus barcinonensis]QKS56155.1 hypothetical protein HUB98_07220 [Paenibacillus barcinonensis]